MGSALLLLALLLFAGAAVQSFEHLPSLLGALGGIALTIGAAIALLNARTYCLTLQDRIIRLEMEVRLARVLDPALAERARALTIKQRVALRFASDAELPALVTSVLDQGLTDLKTIKKMVKDWQADHQRV
jgi:hypothetical protein